MHSKEWRLRVFIVPIQTMGDVSAWVAIIGQGRQDVGSRVGPHWPTRASLNSDEPITSRPAHISHAI